jgi:hypothetical protein
MRHVLNLPPDGLASVPKSERPRIRQALLIAAGKTYEDLANAMQLSPVYVGYIINDQRTGYKIRPLIAKLLGYRVCDLWPETPNHREAA